MLTERTPEDKANPHHRRWIVCLKVVSRRKWSLRPELQKLIQVTKWQAEKHLLQAAGGWIMRIKLPHTPLEELICVGLWFIGLCLLLEQPWSLSLYLASKSHKRCSLPSLLYEFLVHIVNRDISQQLFWNIFFYLYSKACNIYIKTIW